MNSWLILLGEKRTPAQLRLSANRRSRQYRERNKVKLRAMERERTQRRLAYFRARNPQRREYMARYMREYRAAA